MRAVQDPHHKGGGRKIHEIQEMNKISLPLRLSQEFKQHEHTVFVL